MPAQKYLKRGLRLVGRQGWARRKAEKGRDRMNKALEHQKHPPRKTTVALGTSGTGAHSAGSGARVVVATRSAKRKRFVGAQARWMAGRW